VRVICVYGVSDCVCVSVRVGVVCAYACVVCVICVRVCVMAVCGCVWYCVVFWCVIVRVRWCEWCVCV